jgi:hypothetical protein
MEEEQSDPPAWRSIFGNQDILEEEALNNVAKIGMMETIWGEGFTRIYALYYSRI